MTGVVGKLTQGAADAGFVYVTDVVAAGDKLKAIELPRRSAAHASSTARRWSRAPRSPRRPRSSSTGCSKAPGWRPCSERGSLPPPDERRRSRSSWLAALAVVLAFLTLPLVAIFVDAGPGELLSSLDDEAAVDALVLSLQATATRAGADRARGHPRGVAAGHALVSAAARWPSRWSSCRWWCRRPWPASACWRRSARTGLLGGALEDAGVELVFQTAGVVVALVFVASPFYIRQALAAFGALDPALIEASRTPGRERGADVRPRGGAQRDARPGGRRGAGVGQGAGRVRRHAGVRGQPQRASPRPRRSRSTSASPTTSPARSRCRP